MKPFVLVATLALIASFSACSSSDDSGGGGGGGSGGNSATTCADGYPTVGKPCAIANEKCVSCGSYACCDIFECQSGAWAQTQKHTACPADAGSDSSNDAAADALDDATDAAGDAADDAAGDALAD